MRQLYVGNLDGRDHLIDKVSVMGGVGGDAGGRSDLGRGRLLGHRSQSADYVFFFFFQAEDGIRDLTVTGVQTCALPILPYNCAWARLRKTSNACANRSRTLQRKLAALPMKSNSSRSRRRIRPRKCVKRSRLATRCSAKAACRRRALRFRNFHRTCGGISLVICKRTKFATRFRCSNFFTVLIRLHWRKR